MSVAYLPESETEAADMVRAAAASGSPLAIEGGGTKRAMGRPVAADAVLGASRLCGIVSYRPDEMVVSARAGTPLPELESVLAENGQRLAFEPVDYRHLLGSSGTPTVGALAAINNSGPRRIAAGAARDSLLGIRFVNGRGEVIRSGGRVMKNVTGLDLVKLLAGSWGTLGFLTEVTFRVLPQPETEQTLLLRGLDDAAATNALAHAMASSADVSGAAHLPETVASLVGGGGPATALRVEGLTESVADRMDRLEALFGAMAPLERLERDASRPLWRQIADCAPFAARKGKPVWRVSITPSAGHAFVMALRMQIAADAWYDWQGGLVWLCLDDGIHDQVIRATLAAHGGGNAMLVRADETVRAAVEVFQPVAPQVERLSQAVRRALDPQGIFNPGRIRAH